MNKFLPLLKNKIIVFDGAMGTTIQSKNLSSDDFWGKNGCNEILVFSKPSIIQDIHSSFLEVGCDVIETNTFGANKLVLQEYGLGEKTYALNKKAAEIAREVADDFSNSSHPRFVSGSIGPGNKLPSLGQIDFNALANSYSEQIEGLVDGGVDMIQIETAQDLLQIKSTLWAVFQVFQKKKKHIPIIVQLTMEEKGRTLLGTDMLTALTTLEPFSIDIIGLNCGTGPQSMSEHVRVLSHNSPRYISVIPNAGMPKNRAGELVYDLSPEDFTTPLYNYVKNWGVNIVGGCCGTDPRHIKRLVEAVKGLSPLKREPKFLPAASSLYNTQKFSVTPGPLIIGERTNAQGSKSFRGLLEEENWEEMVEVALKQEKEGAHLLDISVALVERNEKEDMKKLLFRLNKEVKIPLMIDTTNFTVMEEALKVVSGKAIINSVNFEEGEEKVKKVMDLCKKLGAGLVGLAIDEEGMAFSVEKKLNIARRFYQLALKEGLNPSNLFFDTLTFSLASGDRQYFEAGKNSLEAIQRIKKEIPQIYTILGISNVSFGLKSELRKILNSVFLYFALQSGLDAAILHAGKIIPLNEISFSQRKFCEDIIFNHRTLEYDPLQELLNLSSTKKNKELKNREIDSLPPGESLTQHIIKGSKYKLEETLGKALNKYSPIEIINRFLLSGMKSVGQLFESGEMQLPFVLKSAEIMKFAVSYLERYMPQKEKSYRSSIILATVQGDVHDIGKNLAGIILGNNGFRVIDLGVKQSAEQIIQANKKYKPDYIGLSGLLVKSALIMKDDLEIFKERKISIPVICGGAALSHSYVIEQLDPAYSGKVYYASNAFAGLKIMQRIAEKKTVPSLNSKNNFLISTTLSRKNISLKEEKILPSNIPTPPFWGTKIVEDISISSLFPYINKKSLYFKQWQLKLNNQHNSLASIKAEGETILKRLQKQALKESSIEPKVVYGYFPVQSQGNSLLVFNQKMDKPKIELVFPRQKYKSHLSIADYFIKHSPSKKKDVISLMLVTIGEKAVEKSRLLFKNNVYQEYLYWHGFTAVMAEALAEFWHQQIRKELSIAGSDASEIEGLFRNEYQGARYSPGYPTWPFIEQQKEIYILLNPKRIGVELSESWQLIPELSISAIIVHHPQARYFSL